MAAKKRPSMHSLDVVRERNNARFEEAVKSIREKKFNRDRVSRERTNEVSEQTHNSVTEVLAPEDTNEREDVFGINSTD